MKNDEVYGANRPEDLDQQHDAGYASGSRQKKRFVEPELSAAIDVLESTTFFQGLDSGPVPPPPPLPN